jgi:hypothetical protein
MFFFPFLINSPVIMDSTNFNKAINSKWKSDFVFVEITHLMKSEINRFIQESLILKF